MELKDIIFEKQNKIATIIINRPKNLNALNANVIEELEKIVKDIKADDDIKAIIITGSGERAFVAGADIGGFLEMDEKQMEEFTRKGKKILREIETIGKPVIAAIKGFCLWGGWGGGFAGACEY